MADILRALAAEYPEASASVAGLSVGSRVDNEDSVSASLLDYEYLPGIRVLPLADFGGPETVFYAADDFARSQRLKEQIQTSGRIDPLIIIIDAEGPYILEGAHRFVALHKIGATHLPALVVADLESLEEALEEARKARAAMQAPAPLASPALAEVPEADPADQESIQEDWGYGGCHYLTLALHRLTGWPIRVLAKAGTREASLADERLRDPMGEIVHSGVELPNGDFLDVFGAHSESLLAEVELRYGLPRAAEWVSATDDMLRNRLPADDSLLADHLERAMDEPIGMLLMHRVPALREAILARAGERAGRIHLGRGT